MPVDPRAASGFASAVEAYERGRPSYPAAAIARLARELGLTRESVVLDLAAGTGKLTRLLVPLAGRVIAVDPSAAMLAELAARLPAVEARSGTAEAIPLADRSVDAVFVGEAFHWFETAAACREIARVLTPSGGLALLWNQAEWSAEELPWLARFEALTGPLRRAAGPFPAEGDCWRRALDDSGLFAPLASAGAAHLHRVDADGFVALIGSWSWIANLPDGQRAELLRAIRSLAAAQRTLTLRYRTELYWTRLA